jgi:hypothetical protein
MFRGIFSDSLFFGGTTVLLETGRSGLASKAEELSMIFFCRGGLARRSSELSIPCCFSEALLLLEVELRPEIVLFSVISGFARSSEEL